MTLLITGGAGYIGGHVAAQLRTVGTPFVVVDDFSTGVADRIVDEPVLDVPLASDRAVDELASFMRTHDVDAVVHFAAKKQVGESVAQPARYWHENIGGLANLVTAMERAGANSLVFSSSAAVYGQGTGAPAREDDPLAPINPYGRTKLAGEQLVSDAVRAGVLRAVSLRYFNVAGAQNRVLADRFALNLVPMLMERLREGRAPLVFGADYPTADGTCVRDYVHVVDLAGAHLDALDALRAGKDLSPALNVGTGRGHSVFEVLDAVQRLSGIEIPASVGPRRAGDPAALVADPTRISLELGWKAVLGLDDMVASAWSFTDRD